MYGLQSGKKHTYSQYTTPNRKTIIGIDGSYGSHIDIDSNSRK